MIRVLTMVQIATLVHLSIFPLLGTVVQANAPNGRSLSGGSPQKARRAVDEGCNTVVSSRLRYMFELPSIRGPARPSPKSGLYALQKCELGFS